MGSKLARVGRSERWGVGWAPGVRIRGRGGAQLQAGVRWGQLAPSARKRGWAAALHSH